MSCSYREVNRDSEGEKSAVMKDVLILLFNQTMSLNKKNFMSRGY